MDKFKKLCKIIIPILIVAMIIPFAINQWVVYYGGKYIIEENNNEQKYDVILVLGAYVDSDGNVCPMLNDRLEVAYKAYEDGMAPKVLLTGDHGEENYDEVNAMKKFMQDKGVEDENIFLDHVGFSTYESMYRARDVFKAKKVLIVTQEYHLYRAVYIARMLGMEADGITSDLRNYRQIDEYKKREFLARNKDFVTSTILKPDPTFLGEPIPVSGDGRKSWD